MINALCYGAPPHGGIAPGVDRIVMLLANEKNIKRSYYVSDESERTRFNDECPIKCYRKSVEGVEPIFERKKNKLFFSF